MICLEKNLITKARCVDHIHGILTDGKFDRVKAFDQNNLRSLCLDCHNKVTFSSGSDQYLEKERGKLGKVKEFEY